MLTLFSMEGISDKCEELFKKIHDLVRAHNKTSDKKDCVITGLYVEKPDGERNYLLYGSYFSDNDVCKALYHWAIYNEAENRNELDDKDNNSMLN